MGTVRWEIVGESRLEGRMDRSERSMGSKGREGTSVRGGGRGTGWDRSQERHEEQRRDTKRTSRIVHMALYLDLGRSKTMQRTANESEREEAVVCTACGIACTPNSLARSTRCSCFRRDVCPIASMETLTTVEPWNPEVPTEIAHASLSMMPRYDKTKAKANRKLMLSKEYQISTATSMPRNMYLHDGWVVHASSTL